MRLSMSIALATLAIGVALAAPPPAETGPAAASPGASTCDQGIDVCCGIFTPSTDPGVLTTLGPGSRVPVGYLGSICALPDNTGACAPVLPVPPVTGIPKAPLPPVATTKKKCTSFSSTLKLAAGCN